jgi:hypothetical protein
MTSVTVSVNLISGKLILENYKLNTNETFESIIPFINEIIGQNIYYNLYYETIKLNFKNNIGLSNIKEGSILTIIILNPWIMIRGYKQKKEIIVYNIDNDAILYTINNCNWDNFLITKNNIIIIYNKNDYIDIYNLHEHNYKINIKNIIKNFIQDNDTYGIKNITFSDDLSKMICEISIFDIDNFSSTYRVINTLHDITKYNYPIIMHTIYPIIISSNNRYIAIKEKCKYIIIKKLTKNNSEYEYYVEYECYNISHMIFTSDNNFIIMVANEKIYGINLNTKEITKYKNINSSYKIHITSDSLFMYVFLRNLRIEVWGLPYSKINKPYIIFNFDIYNIEFSPDGKQFVTCTKYNDNNTIINNINTYYIYSIEELYNDQLNNNIIIKNSEDFIKKINI